MLRYIGKRLGISAGILLVVVFPLGVVGAALATILAQAVSALLVLVVLMRLPEELTPMIFLRPLTGSGSIVALGAIFETCGVDSRAGRIASVLMGSSETIFYTMTVYLGAAGVKRLPHVMWVSLTAYLFSTVLCGWLM